MRPIDTKKFEKYLISKGLEYKRTKASHDIWDKVNPPFLSRPVIIRPKDKQVPVLHIKTNLRTMGINVIDFYKEIENY